MITRTRYQAGLMFREFMSRPIANKPLWEAIYKRASVDPALIERVRVVGGRWHLLVLNEDWCGDSVNILPFLAKLVDEVPETDMSIIRRDENLDITDLHLTGTSRSIPIVILLDEAYEECGWWGPRPRELQRWVLEEGLKLSKEERYKQVRTWYARDRGATTMRELVEMIERCSLDRCGGAVSGSRNPVPEDPQNQ